LRQGPRIDGPEYAAVVDEPWAAEARRLARRYITEVVERFDFCPWAAPARARGEVWMDVVEPDQIEVALARFVASSGAVVGLVIIPEFAGPPSALRQRRDELLAGPFGRDLALADFHPDGAFDRSHPSRLVRYLRRSPDPMLQAVRHADLAGLHRTRPPMSAADQAAVLAGREVTPFHDPIAAVATNNLTAFDAHVEEVERILDDIHADRRRTYAGRPHPAGTAARAPSNGLT
jgi:hypothetical protein